MNLVRSRLAGARLDAVATIRIGTLVHSLRCVWKTGRVALDLYLELWNLSVKGIQHLIRMFLFRRRVSRVSRAITTCKKIFRGQVARRAMRAAVARIQADLDSHQVDTSSPCRYAPFRITSDSLIGRDRLSAGVNIITNDQNLPVVVDEDDASVGQVSVASKPRALRRQPPLGRSGSSAWFSSSQLQGGSMASPLLAATASFCSQEELEAHVQSCHSLGEDVPCLLSIRSVLDDSTVRWVPFCLLPDDGVRRLLTATALMLTAQSFDVMDCMRVVYVVRMRQRQFEDEGIWQSLRSVFIQGTRMGPKGFGLIASLGLRHLHTLSLSGIGLRPALGLELGKMLADVLPGDGGCAISKLYIESEPQFGNKGVVALSRYLQFNTSLRILSLRDCGLGRDCVPALANFLSLSTHLEVLHLSDNKFRLYDCRVLVRSVANKGLKGAFRSLYLQGSPVSHAELEHIYTEGLALGVAIVTPIGFRKELLGELAVSGGGGDVEQRKQREVKRVVEERLRLHQLDLSEANIAHKEVIF